MKSSWAASSKREHCNLLFTGRSANEWHSKARPHCTQRCDTGMRRKPWERVLQTSFSLGTGPGQAPDGSSEGHNNLRVPKWQPAASGSGGPLVTSPTPAGKQIRHGGSYAASWLWWFAQDWWWQVSRQKMLVVQCETATLAAGAGPAFKLTVICGQMSSLLTWAW